MDKYLCERCGKELVFRCAYSRIDHKLICVECDDKEQPKELMKQIVELEAKLAESNESHHKNIVEFTKIATEKDRKIEELKQQLAENEKFIEWCKKSIDTNRKLCEMAVKNQNQTAIAELEKAKEKVLKIDKTEIKTLENGWSVLYVDEAEVITVINQQIKSLKGEK